MNKNFFLAFIIGLSLTIFIYSYANIANAVVKGTLSVSALTPTTVTLKAYGFNPGQNFDIYVFNSKNTQTPSFEKTSNVRSDDSGNVDTIPLFTGLTPGGSYYASTSDSPSTLYISFSTPPASSPNSLNLTTLKTTIISARALYDNSTEGVNLGQYKVGSKSIFKKVIDQSEGVVYDPSTSNLAQRDIDNFNTDLNTAIRNFQLTQVGYSIGSAGIFAVKNIGQNSVTIEMSGFKRGDQYVVRFFKNQDLNDESVPPYNKEVIVAIDNSGFSRVPAFTGLTPGAHYISAYKLNGTDTNDYKSSIFIQTLTTTGIPVKLPDIPSHTWTGDGTSGSSQGFVNSISNDFKDGIVPKCNTGEIDKVTMAYKNPCDFDYFMQLINRVIKFLLFVIAAPLLGLIIIYIAYLFLTSGGSSENLTKAKHILMNAVIGYVIALAAWLIINTILNALGVHSGVGSMFLKG